MNSGRILTISLPSPRLVSSNINLWHVKKYRITTDKTQKRFNSIPSVETMIDIQRMQFIGKLVHGPVSLPPRQLLIAFVSNFWEEGRPIKCNREIVWESLRRLVKYVRGMHIDHMGSLKDWYLDAPDDIFWNKSVEHLRDHRNPEPGKTQQRYWIQP